MLGLTLGDKRTTRPRPEIYPQNLSIQYLVVWGWEKGRGSKEGGGIIQISQKRKLFQSHKELSAI